MGDNLDPAAHRVKDFTQAADVVKVLVSEYDPVEPVEGDSGLLKLLAKRRHLVGQTRINQDHVVLVPDEDRMNDGRTVGKNR